MLSPSAVAKALTVLGNRHSDDKDSRGGIPDAASEWYILEIVILFWKWMRLDLYSGVATHGFQF